MAVLAAAAACLLTGACERDPLRVDDPWVAATPPGAVTAAAYMRIVSNTQDRLVGARSDLSRAVELHTHVERGGMLRMTPVEALALAPGVPIDLAPGGDHLMLTGLTRALAPGEEIVVTLEFERLGTRAVALPVHDVRAAPSEHAHGP